MRVAATGPACYHSDGRRSGGMADAAVLKTVGGNPVRVRVPPSAPALGCRIPRFSEEGAGFCFWGNESPRESLGKRESHAWKTQQDWYAYTALYSQSALQTVSAYLIYQG